MMERLLHNLSQRDSGASFGDNLSAFKAIVTLEDFWSFDATLFISSIWKSRFLSLGTQLLLTAPAKPSVVFGTFFFSLPTLVSSAIKADSVLRQQRPRGMYSKVSLTIGWGAGKAVLHRGRAQWGRRTCMYCTLHAGGGACHDHRGSTPRNCGVVIRSKTKIKE